MRPVAYAVDQHAQGRKNALDTLVTPLEKSNSDILDDSIREQKFPSNPSVVDSSKRHARSQHPQQKA